jgi:hypothetical protein
MEEFYSKYSKTPTAIKKVWENKQTINSMYTIKIDEKIVAVSDNILTAMVNVRKLVADYVGVRNENAIEFKTHGIEYLPWADSATAVLKHDDKLFTVFITSIKLV